MSIVQHLLAFGIRQVVDPAIMESGGALRRYFSDHSKTLPKALSRANDRAWQSIGVALAGDGFLDRVKVFFASGDDKGIRDQVKAFLDENRFGLEGSPAEFRVKCLAELQSARQAGVLAVGAATMEIVGGEAATLQRYSDPQSLAQGAHEVVAQMAVGIRADYPNLATLIGQRPGAGPPLLVASFSYFFRREVECNEELAHGLFLDSLRQLSASQAKGLSEMRKALESLGDDIDRIFDQLGRIETAVLETKSTATATHGVVLDLRVELERQGSRSEELHHLMAEVHARIGQLGMQRGEVKPQHSFSIRSDAERHAVKQLLERYRNLPAETQRGLPALQNGIGKLLYGSGDFEGARQQFQAGSLQVADRAAQAELHYNAYCAALELHRWPEALAAVVQAASLDAQFAPFPMHRYEPRRILGAGGFGTAFLCFDKFFKHEVVVKTLHDGSMERSIENVFEEARLLSDLRHPGVIGVRDCNFTDSASAARPFIVMDYFPGTSLETFVEERGCLTWEQLCAVAIQIAEAMQAAHARNILHRDLKPANVLVRKEGDHWQVKIIDFGLAMRKDAIDTSMAPRSGGSTILAKSVAGTVKYAPPEQMGEMKGVRPGAYSDVFAFGKLCFFALFRNTEPKSRQLSSLPEAIAHLLEACTEQDLEHRIRSFDAVLAVLKNPTRVLCPESKAIATEDDEEAIPTAELLPEAAGATTDETMTHGPLQTSPSASRLGESELSRLVVDLLEHSQSFANDDGRAAIDGVCKAYRIASERASEIIDATRDTWERNRGGGSLPAEGETAEWLYYQAGAQHGPVAQSTLRSLIAAGTLQGLDYVWKQGMRDWKAVKDVFPSLPSTSISHAKAQVVLEVAGANPMAHVAEKSLRGFMTLAREGLSSLKPFAADILRFYLDDSYVGEGASIGDFSVTCEASLGDHVLDVVRLVDGVEKDRIQSPLALPRPGSYRFRFDQGRRIIGGLETSRLDALQTP